MINLLPKDRISQLHASRQNTLLIRYVIASLITLGIAIAIHLGTFGLLKTTESSSIVTSKENQAKVAEYHDIRNQSKEYVDNLKVAKSIFSQNISYVDAIQRVTEVIPEGTILQGLVLDRAIIDQPTTLTLRAKSYEAGMKVKDSLQNSDIAKNVSLSSINTHVGVETPYPFTVVVNLTYTKNLLSPGGEK